MKRESGMLIGTSELFLNGIRLNGERQTECISKYISDLGIVKFINVDLLGYYSKDGLISLPELEDYFGKCEILNFSIIDSKTGDLLHKGECVIRKIKVTYPDNNVSVITVKFHVL